MHLFSFTTFRNITVMVDILSVMIHDPPAFSASRFCIYTYFKMCLYNLPLNMQMSTLN